MIRQFFGQLLKRHLLTKFFASFLLMAALTVGLLWLIQAGLMRDMYLNQRINEVRSAVDAAAAKAQKDGRETIDIEQLSASINASIIVFDAAGNVQSTAARIPMMGMAMRHMQEMISSANFSVCEIFTTNDPSTRFALIGQHLGGQGHLFALFSLDDVDAAARILRSQLSLITGVLALAAILLAFILSHRLSRPILAATRAARQLAAGQLETRLPVRGRDEIAELTQALNELGAQLQVTENLRRELIANVSHELRSPLAVIQGYAETVRDVTWTDEQKRSSQLTMIANEAARLTAVVGDILDYSKLQAGVKPPQIAAFDGAEALLALSRRFELEAAARQLQITVQADVRMIRFDPRQFDQVVTNLLSNALSHADSGSVIEIQAAPLLEPAATSGLPNSSGGSGSSGSSGSSGHPRARISIRNQGPTIPPDELPRIWERFYRAEQVGEIKRHGSGLGLAIVRSILVQHQAQYGVASQDHRTTFWFETV